MMAGSTPTRNLHRTRQHFVEQIHQQPETYVISSIPMLASPIFATSSSRNPWISFSTHGTIKTHVHFMVNDFHHNIFIPIIPNNLYLNAQITQIYFDHFNSLVSFTFYISFINIYIRYP